MRGAGTTSDGLSDREFAQLRDACLQLFGVTIPVVKREIAESRLRSLARSMGGGASASSLVRGLIRGDDENVASRVVDALTTNHTFFGREHEHFDFLTQEILPDLVRRRGSRRDLRMWCAAAATGEEPYYLQMLLMDHLGRGYREWRAGLLATDISLRALTVAREGIYDANRVEGLSPTFRERYLEALPGNRFRIRPEVREEVLYRRFNLMTEVYPFREPFDVIFCRNVMIYFERPQIEHVVDRMARLLKPGSWLFIGMAETLPREDLRFERLHTGIYRRTHHA